MAKLIIPLKSKEQLKHIYDAEDALAKAGVTFDVDKDFEDVGKSFKPINRIWDLDWSLKGAIIKE